MEEKLKNLLYNLHLMIEFIRYNNIQNPQDNEFLWGNLDVLYSKYSKKVNITKGEIKLLDSLLDRMNKEYGNSFKIWYRNEKIKGFL